MGRLSKIDNCGTFACRENIHSSLSLHLQLSLLPDVLELLNTETSTLLLRQ